MNFKQNKFRILGIDPGLEGAVAVFDSSSPNKISAVDIPTIGEGTKRIIDIATLNRWLAINDADIAYLEYVSAMPGWGSGGSFRFGMSFGALRAWLTLRGIPYVLVPPTKWKKVYNLKGGEKEDARRLACQMFPGSTELFERKKDHQRAEASLLAHYGFQLSGRRVEAQPL